MNGWSLDDGVFLWVNSNSCIVISTNKCDICKIPLKLNLIWFFYLKLLLIFTESTPTLSNLAKRMFDASQYFIYKKMNFRKILSVHGASASLTGLFNVSAILEPI